MPALDIYLRLCSCLCLWLYLSLCALLNLCFCLAYVCARDQWLFLFQTHQVALIIPFRNRSEQLSIFVRHMHPMLKSQNLDYRIFVVEQVYFIRDFGQSRAFTCHPFQDPSQDQEFGPLLMAFLQ